MSQTSVQTSNHMAQATSLFTRFILTGLLAGLLISTAQSAGTLQPFESNFPGKGFSLTDIKGVTHTLDDYRGKVVAVNFWASWCPPCIKEMPSMQRLHNKLSDEIFVMLPVNVGEKKYKVWKFAKLVNFTVPVLLDTDSETFNAWDVSVLPTSFLLDKQGRVRYRVQGDLEWDSEEVVSIIKKLINEKQENTL
jgi:thiol-disulfide isomerase/thioredoxin